jgi:hypothetical protein
MSIQKSVKNRNGALKLFSVLIYSPAFVFICPDELAALGFCIKTSNKLPAATERA